MEKYEGVNTTQLGQMLIFCTGKIVPRSRTLALIKRLGAEIQKGGVYAITPIEAFQYMGKNHKKFLSKNGIESFSQLKDRATLYCEEHNIEI